MMSSFSSYTDEQLLSFVKEGNENAFAELFTRYAKTTRSLAYSRVRCKVMASEIVQDIFSSLWQKRDSVDTIDKFSNYLAVSVKYQALNQIRKKINFKKYSHLYTSFIKISEEDTWQSVQYNDLANALKSSLMKLPEKSQRIFSLNRLEGKSILEIAEALHLSEKTIQYHILTCQKKLRSHLKDFLLAGTIIFFI